MNIKSRLNKIKNFLFFFYDCYKKGGYTRAVITQVEHDNMFRGKKVLVTGGSSGIGFSTAKKYISLGAEVVITGRNVDKLNAAKDRIKSENLHVIEWDASDLSISDVKLDCIFNKLGGPIDILVNNAGVLLKQDFFTLSEDVWDETYAINSKGVYFLCQKVANIWIKNAMPGRIINISSSSAFYGSVIPYGLTKWDINGLTEGLGKKLYPYNIIVNGIAPGRTATSMLGRDKGHESNIYDSVTSAKRYCLPEEIAEIAMFLSSDSTSFVVGQTIVCDGGYTL